MFKNKATIAKLVGIHYKSRLAHYIDDDLPVHDYYSDEPSMWALVYGRTFSSDFREILREQLLEVILPESV